MNQRLTPAPSNPLRASRERLSEYLATSGQALTRADVLAGWTRAQLERALRDKSVVRLLPGVYCGAGHVRSTKTLGEALNLWAPRGLVSGELALRLYAPTLPAPTTANLAPRDATFATVVVPAGDKLRAPGWVRVIQTAPVRPAIAQGVRCVTPARAVLDAWGAAPAARRRDVVYGALWERVCTWRELRRALDRAPRVRGRRELERLLGWFALGATSPLEVRARRDVFAGPRFAELEWQVVLRARSRRVRVDALHRAAKVAVELDGARYHAGAAALAADRTRDVELAAAGYVTVRFGWNDVVEKPRWCRRRVLTIIEGRLERPART